MVDDASGHLSQAAYARSRGWSPQYISKLKKQGKLPLTADGKVDPVVADAALASVKDGNRDSVRAANTRRKSGGAAASPYVESPLSKATIDDKTMSAALKQLEVERQSGRVCLTERVVKAVGDNQAAAAQMLDQMVERCFNRIAAESDPARVRQMLQAEVREVKLAIANFAASLPGRITETSQ